MAYSSLKQFKGLAQHVDENELSPEFCHTLQNLDVDNPLGRLTQRFGYSKKYADAFTNILSAHEHYIEKADDTILIFNDNGTIKKYVDGASLTSLSLPSGVTLEASFRNQYFGWKNHILITTGNGSTNNVIGYYYLKRVNASNNGLFGDVEQFTGYKLLKAQMIFGNGVFSGIRDIVNIGTEYFFSFQGNTSVIEKRDASLRLIERFDTQLGVNATDGLCLATDATNLYVGGNVSINKYDPDNWEVLATNSEAESCRHVGMDWDTTNSKLWVVRKAHSANSIEAFNSSLASTDTSDVHAADINYEDIVVMDGGGGATDIFVLENESGTAQILRYESDYAGGPPNDIDDGAETHDSSAQTLVSPKRLEKVSGGVRVSDFGDGGTTHDGKVYEFLDTNLVLDTTESNIVEPYAFFSDTLTVSDKDGIIKAASGTDITYPTYFGITYLSEDTDGDLATGTYFYKISMVDEDGQEFPLSDPIRVILAATADIRLQITANADELDYFYRLKSINVYRAYNAAADATEEATNYKLLKTVDINASGWEKDTNLDGYRFEITDSLTEDEISSVTFKENAGYGEDVKPRYVNYKFHVWIRDQLHAANFYYDDPESDVNEYPNRIVPSQVNSPDVIPLYNSYDFAPYDGDEIQNVSEIFGRLVAFKTRWVGLVFNALTERVLMPGLADTDAFFKDGDQIWYVSDKGLHLLAGNSVANIRDAVTTSFDTISSFTGVNVFVFDDKDRVIFSNNADLAFVYNKRHNVWMEYGAAFAFKGYFKNRENEYIGWGVEPNGASHYFFELDNSTTDNAEDISTSYRSPLIKFGDIDGIDNEVLGFWYRHSSTGTYTLKIYIFREASKATGLSFTMNDPTSTSMAAMTKHLQNVWGEGFQVEIIGSGTVFQLSGLALEYIPIGVTENVV